MADDSPNYAPRSYRKYAQQVSIGIEKLLCVAANDPAFRADLLRRRLDAVSAAGFALKPSEEAILRAASEVQLESMIARIDLRAHRRSKLMQTVQAVAFAAAASATAMVTPSCGAGVDPEPPNDTWEIKLDIPSDDVPDDTDVASPDTADAPNDVVEIEVEETITNGITPDLIEQ